MFNDSRILVPTLRVGTQRFDAPASQEALTNVVLWTCAIDGRCVLAVRSHAERGNENFAVRLPPLDVPVFNDEYGGLSLEPYASGN